VTVTGALVKIGR